MSSDVKTTLRDPSREHAIEPLLSVSDIPDASLPTIQVPDNKYSPLTDHGTRRAKNSRGTIDDHVRGVLGEYSVASAFGIPDQVDTEIYDYGDPGYDLCLSGKTIDVKTAGPHIASPKLLVHADAPITADHYVLVHELDSRFYRIIGCAPAALVASAPVRTLPSQNRAKVRVVEQHQLHPIPPTTIQ